MLIDGALPGTVGQITANIRTLGFKPSDVRYLLINHAHFDHAGGARRAQAADRGAAVRQRRRQTRSRSGADRRAARPAGLPAGRGRPGDRRGQPRSPRRDRSRHASDPRAYQGLHELDAQDP
ncbi:MAG: MBL fold metallo-hydrolase [Sphingomonas sp.]